MVLGGVAFKALFDENAPLKDVHGQIRERESRMWLITYHPASAMRFPDPKKRIYADFRKLAEMLG